MLNSYRIIDADGHVVEPVEMWEKYLDPEFKARAPLIGGDVPVNGKAAGGFAGLPSAASMSA